MFVHRIFQIAMAVESFHIPIIDRLLDLVKIYQDYQKSEEILEFELYIDSLKKIR